MLASKRADQPFNFFHNCRREESAGISGYPLGRSAEKKGPLVREEDGVDDADDALGLVDVGDGDFGHAALLEVVGLVAAGQLLP